MESSGLTDDEDMSVGNNTDIFVNLTLKTD